MDTQAIMVEWLAWLSDVKRRTPLTCHQYAGKLETLATTLGATPLVEATTEQLEGWLHRPRVGRGHGEPSASTVQKELAILRGLYAYAMARGYVRHDPTALLAAPPVRNRHPKPVPDDVWMRQWACEQLPAEAIVVLGLGYLCGLRRSEITGLRVDQVDTEARALVGFARKGGGDDVLDYGELVGLVGEAHPKLLPEPDVFLGALEREVAAATKDRRDHVLWWGLRAAERSLYAPHGGPDPQLVYKRLWRWQRLAGLDAGAFSPHQLRHSFVTNLLRAGMPLHLASVLANHSDVSITMRYAKLGGADLREFRARLRDQ